MIGVLASGGLRTGEGLVEGFVFARYCVGKEEVEGSWRLFIQELDAVFEGEGEAGVVAEQCAGD